MSYNIFNSSLMNNEYEIYFKKDGFTLLAYILKETLQQLSQQK